MTDGSYTREQLEQMDVDVLDRWAFGVAGGDQVTLPPHQIRILYPCDLPNPEFRFQKEGLTWARSVVPIDRDMDVGHHPAPPAESGASDPGQNVSGRSGRPG